MASNFSQSTSNREHVVAGHNVRAMLDVLDIKRIRMITDMDDVCPLNCLLQQWWKDNELVCISQPFGGCAAGW
jgi:hypothetical protein